MDKLNEIVTHLNAIQSKEVFKMYHVNGISSHLTVNTYRDIDKMIKACNEHQ
jgi:hypothetical protein